MLVPGNIHIQSEPFRMRCHLPLICTEAAGQYQMLCCRHDAIEILMICKIWSKVKESDLHHSTCARQVLSSYQRNKSRSFKSQDAVGMAHMNFFDTKFSLIRVLMQQAGPRKTWRIVATLEQIIEAVTGHPIFAKFVCWKGFHQLGLTLFLSWHPEFRRRVIPNNLCWIDLQLHMCHHSNSLDFWCDW